MREEEREVVMEVDWVGEMEEDLARGMEEG